MKNLLLLFIFYLGLTTPVEAQIFKKLKEKITKSAEESVSKRVEKKADEQVEKGLDGIFESNKKSGDSTQNPYGNSPMRASSSDKEPRASYEFDYKLEVEMRVDEEKMDMGMDYLLSSKGDYYAMEMNQGVSMLMVTDAKQKAMFQFMDMGANKMMMVQDLDFSDEDQQNIENTKINKLPNKQVMGYNCEGIEIVNKEFHSQIYFTKEAPVNFTFFNDPEQSKRYTIPAEVEKLMNEDFLMLEMQMEDLKEGIEVMWKAKSLNQHNRSVNTSGYRRM